MTTPEPLNRADRILISHLFVPGHSTARNYIFSCAELCFRFRTRPRTISERQIITINCPLYVHNFLSRVTDCPIRSVSIILTENQSEPNPSQGFPELLSSSENSSGVENDIYGVFLSTGRAYVFFLQEKSLKSARFGAENELSPTIRPTVTGPYKSYKVRTFLFIIFPE